MNNAFFNTTRLTTIVAVSICCFLIIAANITCSTTSVASTSDGNETDINFSSDIPPDVNVTLKERLDSQKKFGEVQKLFDVVSWQTFVAACWPMNANGKPQTNLSDPGHPQWSGWKESFEVYKSDGSEPLPWGVQRAINDQIPGHENLTANATQKDKRVLFRDNKHKENADIADEFNQAFTGAIWDQNGGLIFYELLMNEPEFDYVKSNKLYNLDGQIEFSNGGNFVDFPWGTYGTKDIGAIEIKISWKILDPNKDIISRYFTMDGYVPDPKGLKVDLDNACNVTVPDETNYIPVKLGMVGMHISHKTNSSPQWIWSTFEHVDNLNADGLITGKTENGKTVNLKPTFYDPNCIECIPNTCQPPGKDGKYRSQLMRMIPIPGDKVVLNQQASEELAGMNSPLQYYELVDTQWPTDPTAGAIPAGNGVESVTRKASGKMTPVFLTNMTMESYFQVGKQIARDQEESYYESTTTYGPQDSVYIFATESCTGCHFSAGIATGLDSDGDAIFGKPQSADFSWLLQTQAHFKKQ